MTLLAEGGILRNKTLKTWPSLRRVAHP